MNPSSIRNWSERCRLWRFRRVRKWFVHKFSWSGSRRTGVRRINSLRRRHSSIWETDFKAEVCSGSNHSSEALRWIEEVVMATSVGDLQTSRSIFGRPFPNIEALDAKIATSLKKIIQNWTFSKKLYVVTTCKDLIPDEMKCYGRPTKYLRTIF